jgi:predicted O-methyltransferase YrrM
MRPELLDLPQPNWFNHGPQILDLIEARRPLVCVELGSNRGCSAIAIARLIRQWGGVLTCVDKWEPTYPGTVSLDVFYENIDKAGVSHDIRAIPTTTGQAALHWVEPINFLYIDADHTYEGCTTDLEMWWPLLALGGLIVGDDYGDPHGIPMSDPRSMSSAWDDFERRHGLRLNRTLSTEMLGCACEKCMAAPLIWGVK